MSKRMEHLLAGLDCPVVVRFNEPCGETMDLDYYEEIAELTVEQWMYLERRMLERDEKAREEYRKEMTAPPEPDHDYRNALIVAIVSGLLLGGVFGGALVILMSRVN